MSALAELYDRHNRTLYSLILRVLRNRSEAEEVLQEAFLLVWNKAATYNSDLAAPGAWLVRIARNRAIDRLRANQTRTKAVEGALPPGPIESPETLASTSERQQAVTRALGMLPVDQRSLIEHAYFQGLTQSELAAQFQLPLGTVKTRIRNGMIALRQALQHAEMGQSDAAHSASSNPRQAV